MIRSAKQKTYKKGYTIDTVESKHDTSKDKESTWRFKEKHIQWVESVSAANEHHCWVQWMSKPGSEQSKTTSKVSKYESDGTVKTQTHYMQ